jgi:hypothetical protein
MTVKQILRQLRPHKRMSRVNLYNYLREFEIKPLSKVRQIPQQYPSNTPKIILKRLGLANANGGGQ